MKITVLFNSASVDKNLATGWGLSLLIDHHVLFDTGEKGDMLLNNIRHLNIDLSRLEAVVLSHDHWDHTGGLWDVLKETKDIPVYACPGFGIELKQKILSYPAPLKEAAFFTRVATGIYSTGEILGTYKDKTIAEQALILQTRKGISVLTGCAHPGIIEVLNKVKTQLSLKEFHSVIGGFHLKNHSAKQIKDIIKEFRRLNVKKVGATHCSGSEAEDLLQKTYKNNFLDMRTGQKLLL